MRMAMSMRAMVGGGRRRRSITTAKGRRGRVMVVGGGMSRSVMVVGRVMRRSVMVMSVEEDDHGDEGNKDDCDHRWDEEVKAFGSFMKAAVGQET